MAAPFVTGVAALLQATDSSLQGHKLLARMIADSRVWTTSAPNDGLLVDAYRAVTDGLRPIAPQVTIIRPGAGSSTGSGTEYMLSARVDDLADGYHCCEADVRWYADGSYVGKGTNVSVTYPSIGTHLIEARYSNSDGLEGSDARILRIDDGAPTIALVHPRRRFVTHYPKSLPVLFQTYHEFMQNWNRGAITCSWWSDVDGPLSVTGDHGCRGTVSFATHGFRRVTVTATDGNGSSTTDYGGVCVSDSTYDCEEYLPDHAFGHASVVSPFEFSVFSEGDVIDLNAHADHGVANDAFEWRWYADSASAPVTVHPAAYALLYPWMGQGAGWWDTTGLAVPNLGPGILCYVNTAPSDRDVEQVTRDCVRITIAARFI
jgi:hypothetical protein